MITLDLIYFNAGGGHRAAAEALQAQLAVQRPRWRARLVDLFEVLDPPGQFRKLTGFAPEAYYNRRLASGFTLGLAQELRVLQAMIRLAHPWLAQRLQQHWLAGEPDAVVSLVPNFNRAIGASLASTLPGVPFVTVMTDLADLPPHFWVEPSHTQHLVCGTEHAAAQALAQGLPPEHVHLASGMLLRPHFYERPADGTREAERAALGLETGQPVGVVLFGGHGSAAMMRIAERLPGLPLVLLCGHNRRLAAELRALPASASAPRIVVDYTRDVARWLRLGDFFVGKPGPGSVSEALHCGLPVIVARNAWTMPQERYNTDWVREQGVGIVLERYGRIDSAVRELVARLPELRANVARLQNRALFELPEILADIVAVGPWVQPPRWAPAGHADAALPS
jgi:UDP-N-acetylglucosamine:LPS N-acetylglucosamine transferase